MARYIDAEKIQSLLEEEIEGCGNPTADDNPIAYGTTLGLKMALSYAKTLPTADAAPVVHAHWQQGISGMYAGKCACSECTRTIKGKLEDIEADCKFCPYCGAKMDEGVKK